MDAIQLAGGALADADLSGVNLVSSLQDGMQLRIPFRQLRVEENESSGSSGDKVLLNRANAKDFEKLPGVGKSIAERIVDYRKTHGAFTSAEDLTKVPGIGKKMLVRLKDRLQL